MTEQEFAALREKTAEAARGQNPIGSIVRQNPTQFCDHDYLLERIRVLEGQRRQLLEEIKKMSFGVYTPLVSETDAESIFLIHECPKCHLQTVQKRIKVDSMNGAMQ